MRRWTLCIVLLGVFAAASAGLTGCDSKKRNAREEVFEADGGRDMNQRLDQYAEAPADAEGDGDATGEPSTEDASSKPDEQPARQPANP